MALHIVIGYDGQSASARPFPVYVGRLDSEAQEAMQKNTEAARFERFSHLAGVRKTNPNYKAPDADAAPVLASEPPDDSHSPPAAKRHIRRH